MSFGLHFTWQMTAGRCHTLLSPVTEESGEEGTNSEISSPPACRSPSPVANTDASVNQVPPTWHSSSNILWADAGLHSLIPLDRGYESQTLLHLVPGTHQ